MDRLIFWLIVTGWRPGNLYTPEGWGWFGERDDAQPLTGLTWPG